MQRPQRLALPATANTSYISRSYLYDTLHLVYQTQTPHQPERNLLAPPEHPPEILTTKFTDRTDSKCLSVGFSQSVEDDPVSPVTLPAPTARGAESDGDDLSLSLHHDERHSHIKIPGGSFCLIPFCHEHSERWQELAPSVVGHCLRTILRTLDKPVQKLIAIWHKV